MQRYLIVAAVSLTLIPLASIGQNAKADKIHADAKPAQNASPPARPKQADSAPRQGKGSDYEFRNDPAEVAVTEGPPKDVYDKAAFWVNVSLAIVGLSGVTVGVCTVLFVRGQVVEMRRQRITMERTLVAMRKQIMLAEDTAKRQLRAYLCYRQARVFIESGKARIVIELENTGQTPAYDVKGIGSSGFGVPQLKPAPLNSVAIIGAGKSFALALPIPQWSDSLLSSATYFVKGEMTYLDIFREEVRTTRFQIGLGAKFGPLHPETEDGKSFYKVMTDSEGNEAD